MKRHLFLFSILCVFLPSVPATAKADDATDAAFARRLFSSKTGGEKSYACFVRAYDRAHLARHPQQKVNAMKLLVTGEKPEGKDDPPGLRYSFRMGVNFIKRKGNFDSSGSCGLRQVEVTDENKAQVGCGVDCDGGGLTVELSKDDDFTLVRLDRIRIWRNNQPEEEGLDLEGGADDRVFRLDRANVSQCRSLITDRKELAAIRTLKK